ncbi:MAG: tetratricopeptide repeat protein [Lacibacter sp.]
MQVKLIIFLLLFCYAVPVFAQTDRADELYRKALLLKKDNKCNEAIDLLKNAIELKPSFAEAMYELSWCYNETQQYKLALPVLAKCRQLLPDDYRIIYEDGFAKAQSGLANEAMDDYNKVIILNPSFARVYIARADLYKDAKENTNAALADYLKSIEYDSSTVKVYYLIGWCYNDLGSFDKAIPYLQKVISFEKQNYLYYSEIGFAYFSLGRYAEAVEQLSRADLLKPKVETTVYYLGLSYVKQNLKPEAVKKYNELVLMGSGMAQNLLNEIKKMN